MTIEYALDGYGNRVTASNAISRKDYICPYCKEIIRFHSRGSGFLWHKPMNERNVSQRACPQYTGKNKEPDLLTKEFSDLEIIYNGGIPLYLCCTAHKMYDLYAIFPSLSDLSYNKMIENNVYILVSDGNVTNRYSMEDRIKFKVCRKEIGLTVKIEDEKSIPREVEKKWLLGMRGLSIQEDIFCSSLDGGYRVSLNSNIVIKKEYILIGEVPKVQGISFEYKGEIYLGYIEQEIFSIYSMVIDAYTDESRGFIESKGYHLIKESDEIIPIWPPAYYKGHELICNEKEEYFFHKRRGDQDIFNWDYTGLYQIMEENNLMKIPTDGRMVLLMDYFYKNVKEIRYRLRYQNIRVLKAPIVFMKATFKGQKLQLPENAEQLPNDSQIIISSNIKFDALILKGLHIEQSVGELIQPIPKGQVIILDCKGFGVWGKVAGVDEIVATSESNVFEVDEVMVIKLLMNLSAPYVVPWEGYGNLVQRIKRSSIGIAKVMQLWGREGKIPRRALPIIKFLEDKFDNE